MIGLAESGGEGLRIASEIYGRAYERLDEFTALYRTVVDIDKGKLPEPKTVAAWSSSEYAGTLRHIQSCPAYNPHFRQLRHISFKLAAEMGKRYTQALKTCHDIVGRNVTENLFDRHLMPIFGGRMNRAEFIPKNG